MRASRTRLAVWLLSVNGLTGSSFAVNIETVFVGNPGNAADTKVMVTDGTSGYGSVDYTYNIGKYEVTAGQYTEFLNAVAKTDTYGLYNTLMWTSVTGCKIQLSGTLGNCKYTVQADYANRPVNYVSWGDAARFANWMHNGQPTGAQDMSTTEDGAYSLNGEMDDVALIAVTRKADWKWAMSSEDEWYKAAYHKNDGVTGNYWEYPTSSDTAPGRDLNDVSGNNANYQGTPYPIQWPYYYMTEVEEFQDSDSPYGTFDQGGNVWEWNESVPYRDSRGFRGGCFMGSDAYPLRASYRGYSIGGGDGNGFRVVQVAEPGSLVLLTIGFLPVIRRSKRWVVEAGK